MESLGNRTPLPYAKAERRRFSDEEAVGHQDVPHTTTGGMNGVPSIERLRDLPNEDTAIWVMELRRRMNATTAAFAEEVGVSPGLVSQWMLGNSRPSQLVTEVALTVIGRQYGMPDPPQGGRSWYKAGPRFAAGIAERFAELYGSRDEGRE